MLGTGVRVRFTSKASIGNIGVFSFIETGKEQYMARKAILKLVSECNWKKLSLICQTYMYEDKHWQLATTYTGDRHFHNLQY